MKNLPKFVVSVDCVIFAYFDDAIQVPLLMRAEEPFINQWALPGGPMQDEENPHQACLRKLEEDIGLKVQYLEQLFTFADPHRDPRDRAISIAHFALIEDQDRSLIWGSDTKTAKWVSIDNLPQENWAFDHQEIVQLAIKRLQAKLSYEPIGLNLLPEEFNLPELKKIYDVILQKKLDRRNFYKRIKATNLLIPTRTIPSKRGKPTQLYKFDKIKYNQLQKEGFSFQI
jgi:8-oxo-dGTP diphosphatase